jgi:hypothetical protein
LVRSADVSRRRLHAQGSRGAAISCVPYVKALANVIQSGDQSLVDDVLRGKRSVLEAAKAVKARVEIVTRYQQLTAADKAAIGRTLGVGVIWDEMVVTAL